MAAVTEELPEILTVPEPLHKLCRGQEGDAVFMVLRICPQPPPQSYARFRLG